MNRLPATQGKRPRPGAAARDRIIAIARREFFANGFRNVTMDDLAAGLGMSKKTFYAHFPGKTGLLKAVLMNKFDHVEADFSRVAREHSSDVAALLEQMLAVMRLHTEEIQPPFLRDMQREAPEMFKLAESRRREILRRYWGKFFRDGRKAGLIRKDIPVNLMIEILLGAVQSILSPSKMADLGLTPKTGALAIIQIILRGVISQKRKSII
jgi:TetR/AcrR family transcriptional regulator, cholesterol catabolism regulator